jgi:hypothetical protein
VKKINPQKAKDAFREFSYFLHELDKPLPLFLEALIPPRGV